MIAAGVIAALVLLAVVLAADGHPFKVQGSRFKVNDNDNGVHDWTPLQLNTPQPRKGRPLEAGGHTVPSGIRSCGNAGLDAGSGSTRVPDRQTLLSPVTRPAGPGSSRTTRERPEFHSPLCGSLFDILRFAFPSPPRGSASHQFASGHQVQWKGSGSQVRRMLVTAYCPCTRCCGPGARGVTASGRPARGHLPAGRSPTAGEGLVAAPASIPFWTMLRVPGYAGGHPVPVLDRGGAIREGRLDVLFPTHAQALAWGVRRLMVEILP